MDYFLKANGIVILWIVFYYLFLKNETFFNSIRLYFLVGLLFVLSIPLIEIPIYIEKTVSNINYSIIEGATIINTPIEQPIDLLELFTVIYFVGVAFFTIKFMIQLLSLGKLISSHKIINDGNYKLVETGKDISPFSFFKYIIYNPSQFTKNELNQIITHEKTHAKQWHSIDTLLTYFLQIIFWFNPFAWGYKNATQQNLEFLADTSVSGQRFNLKQYQFTLLKASSTYHYEAITNNFYNSLIKKRIVMLNKSKSKRINYLKYILVTPLLAVFLFAFNTKTIAQEKDKKQSQWTVSAGVTIDKNTSELTLSEVKDVFQKQEVEFSYKTKRNSENEIRAIDITLESMKENTIMKSSASFDNVNEAIKPIHIIYNQNSNTVSIQSEGKTKLGTISSTKSTTQTTTSGGQDSDNSKNYSLTAVRTNDNYEQNNPIDPLYIVNGKEISKEMSEIIDPEKIESVNVLKNSNATEKYGEKGKNGVVEINTKTKNNSTISLQGKDPLIILDGTEISKKEMDNLNTNNIESINVLKDKSAETQYGSKGKNGVVEITSKSNFNSQDNKRKTVIENSDNNQNYNITFDDGSDKSVSTIDNKGENILIEGSGTVVLNKKDSPLLFVGNKEITKSELEKINPSSIKSINVLKGKNAKKKYGKKAKNGVIEITLK
ncbi:hypothetical protein FF125_19535 [Aureibaculum algae]|uniref:M56 family peptidase n=1 Tax=Aureibaculum algae TaxID=2584122 RepID=A0A5B7TUI9_9FLAO|nr:M56 family metallopeptidase [Aureibaculum algae]QCX40529.1 hypothetical protein FF125_19535 [Aureibaculum algae]